MSIGLRVMSLLPIAHFECNSNSHIIVIFGNIYSQVDDHIHSKHSSLMLVIILYIGSAILISYKNPKKGYFRKTYSINKLTCYKQI